MGNKKYEDFLRSLNLYNVGVTGRSELLTLLKAPLSKLGLFQTFKELISGHSEEEPAPVAPKSPPPVKVSSSKSEIRIETIEGKTCTRIGASYIELPKDHSTLKASQRTELDNEVLNETWHLDPPAKTETVESGKSSKRKNDFDEYELICEDERFELDMIMEPNSATLRALEVAQKKMSRMTPEELKTFHLDEYLGGRSEVIHQKAIRLVYGEEMGPKIIDGMRNAPQIAIPLVLRRLKDKDREWRIAQKGFNQLWREQLEKFATSSSETESKRKHNESKKESKANKAAALALAEAVKIKAEPVPVNETPVEPVTNPPPVELKELDPPTPIAAPEISENVPTPETKEQA
jgi:paired amphipathic helix protein Sin3a